MWANRGDIRSRLHIDHCHSTGRIRGLLCSQCNFAIGYYEKHLNLSQELIRIYDQYLKE